MKPKEWKSKRTLVLEYRSTRVRVHSHVEYSSRCASCITGGQSLCKDRPIPHSEAINVLLNCHHTRVVIGLFSNRYLLVRLKYCNADMEYPCMHACMHALLLLLGLLLLCWYSCMLTSTCRHNAFTLFYFILSYSSCEPLLLCSLRTTVFAASH